jgi:hypothetical protein
MWTYRKFRTPSRGFSTTACQRSWIGFRKSPMLLKRLLSLFSPMKGGGTDQGTGS